MAEKVTKNTKTHTRRGVRKVTATKTSHSPQSKRSSHTTIRGEQPRDVTSEVGNVKRKPVVRKKTNGEGVEKTLELIKEIIPEMEDGKVHKISTIIETGKIRFLKKDYNQCIKSALTEDKVFAKTLTIPEKAVFGGEVLVNTLITKAVKNGIVTKTSTGYKLDKITLKEVFPHLTEKPYSLEDDSPQLWGDVSYYGGMSEWEGWSYSPLKTRDLVHVRLVHPVSLEKLRQRFIGWDVSESPEGTVVITGKPGDPVKEAVMEWLKKENIAHESVRTAKKVRRRNLRELPPNFLHDLLKRTVPLAYATVIKKHRASMEILTGSQDDTKAWVSLWVTEFATMFDADKGRPFAAWAQIQIKHKVQDLNRAINGRTASDLEIKWARAYESLENVLGRAPTEEELSQELNFTGEELRNKKSIIGQMKAIRSAAPIETGPDFADLPVVDHLADPEHETLRLEARQMVTLAMLNAAGRVDDVTGERILELPLGFIATYLMEWDDWVKSDLVYLSGFASSKIGKEINLLRDSLKAQLEGVTTQTPYL